MSEKKEKGLNYYRQSKGYGYTPPLSHPIKDKRIYNFTQKELIDYIIKCMSTVKTSVDEKDRNEVEEFVKNKTF